MCFFVFGNKLVHNLEPKHKTVKALEQCIVEVTRNPFALSQAFCHARLNLRAELPDAQAKQEPGYTKDSSD
jgi:hypothetical protein